MKLSFLFLGIVLLWVLKSFGQAPKLPTINTNRPLAFSDSATQVLKNVLNKSLKMSQSQTKDSIVYRNLKFIYRNYIFNDNCDSVLRYGEIHKKYATERGNKMELLIALHEIKDSYVWRLNKNPLKIPLMCHLW